MYPSIKEEEEVKNAYQPMPQKMPMTGGKGMFNANEEEDRLYQQMIEQSSEMQNFEMCKYCKNRITAQDEKDDKVHCI